MARNLLNGNLLSKRERYQALYAQLYNERSSFISRWRDLADFILPTRPRFFVQETGRGERKNFKIVDNTATLAVRTARAGMMSGITSPARPWFRLTTPDPDLAENDSVKEWLSVTTDRMVEVFLRSNLYNILPICYGDLNVFGTAPIMVEEDLKDVVRFYSFPIGSYFISNNSRLQVDTFVREFKMTVRQILEEFGMDESGKIDWTNISTYIQQMYERGQAENWITVCHVIKPNPDYDPRKLHSKHKKYISCYYERGFSNGGNANYIQQGSDDSEKFLRESGYDYFPVLCPRWEISGEDSYGTDCPGMTAIGDIRQLQAQERRAAQAIEKMVNPPMIAPSSLKNQKTSILPGDVTYEDSREGMKGFRPAHEINFRLQELEQKQQQLRSRIQRSFYEDLFLMLSESDRREITAREIDERHEEKLLALGPVLEQLNQDLLDPLIDIVFNIMLRQNLVPKPPQELQGKKIAVQYISIMAQSQKLIGVASVERFTGFVNQIGQVQPAAFDKIDVDQLIDTYGDMTSIPPKIIRPDDQVQGIRAQRAKAQQMQQQSEMAAQNAQSAKTLSQTDMNSDSALKHLIQQSQGI